MSQSSSRRVSCSNAIAASSRQAREVNGFIVVDSCARCRARSVRECCSQGVEHGLRLLRAEQEKLAVASRQYQHARGIGQQAEGPASVAEQVMAGAEARQAEAPQPQARLQFVVFVQVDD